MRFGGVCLAAALAIASGSAHAELLDDAAKKIAAFEAEATSLGSNIQKPTDQPQASDTMSRRVIDAQVAFGVGDFDSAALLLYDYVAQKTRGREYDTALYYLGESLFQKGDSHGARKYLAQLVHEAGSASKYYQQALERLIELSLTSDEQEGVAGGTVTEWMSNLDAIAPDKRLPSVAYVRGKYAFSQGKYDDAIRWFQLVPQAAAEAPAGKWSRPAKANITANPAAGTLAFQTGYYIGASYVAKKDLDNAAQTFEQLIMRKPQNADERRILELSQLALGRLYYERDQPTKALDTYLLIDRKSDLFSVVLYEISWLYVKAKQYDKALRALELLALSDPNSHNLPNVRILEGNLRIRKAQAIHENIVTGVNTDDDNGLVEYSKAEELFTRTYETYAPPHQQLASIIAAHNDPAEFLAQVTGRSAAVLQATVAMPEVATAWIREEPSIEQTISVENNLDSVGAEIAEAERTIQRLEAMLTLPNRVRIFPALASKRVRSTEIFEGIMQLRTALAEEERKLAERSNQGDSRANAATAARKALAARIAELPNSELEYGERLALARDSFDELERKTAEIQIDVGTSRSTLLAVDSFLKTATVPNDPELKTAWEAQRAEAAIRLPELETELSEIQREVETLERDIDMGRDQAGSTRDTETSATTLRSELRAALAAEHAAMESAASQTNAARAGTIGRLIRQCDSVLAKLGDLEVTIDAVVEGELVGVRNSLEQERAEVSAYRREFLLYKDEARQLGSSVLADAFLAVKNKLYDILVRTDIGILDISWSQKEEADDDLQRLGLDKQREIKHLKDDFADLMREAREQPAPSASAPGIPPASSGVQP